MRLSTAISAFTATAPLLALTASAAPEEATGTRQWAHYKEKRQDGSPARPGISPLPVIDINVSIQTQIKVSRRWLQAGSGAPTDAVGGRTRTMSTQYWTSSRVCLRVFKMYSRQRFSVL